MKGKVEAVIEEVVIQPSKIQPIIVNFQNGALKDEETNRMSCGVYHDSKEDKTVLAMSNGQVVYKGYRPDSEKALTYTMLAIHNKRTGKIRLIQAERWQVAPVLDQHVDINDGIDAKEKQIMLNKQFGSKKMKRRTEQFERMKVNIDSVKEQLENTVAHVEIDRAELSTQSATDETLDTSDFPECNRDADNVEDVYNLHDIIPKDVLTSLYEKISEIEQLGTDGKSAFYVKTINSLASDSQRTKKVAILEYIEAVRKWLNIPIHAAKRRTIDDIYPHCVQLNNYVVETYSMIGAKGRQRPNSMRDKGIIHCMILALMVCSFELNLELFSTILSSTRGMKKLSDLARIIGAVTVKDDKNLIVLKIPLPPPLSTVRKGKRK